MLTFHFDISHPVSTQVLAIIQASLHQYEDVAVTFTEGYVLTQEGSMITALGRYNGNTGHPVRSQGIFGGELSFTARWFLLLSAVFGSCSLQDSNGREFDVMESSIETLKLLANAQSLWQQQIVEESIGHFRRYTHAGLCDTPSLIFF